MTLKMHFLAIKSNNKQAEKYIRCPMDIYDAVHGKPALATPTPRRSLRTGLRGLVVKSADS